MGEALPKPAWTAADYLAWEAQQAERHEWVDGEVFAMTGARDAHNRVAGNLYVFFRAALRGTPCRTFMSDMKLHVAEGDAFVYPDVFVTCDERDRGEQADLAKRHPRLVVEVLSDSTAAYDRGRKFALYRGIEGLAEVMFVEPDAMQVDLFRRGADGLWVLHPHGAGGTIDVQSLGLQLPVAAVYDDVLAA